MNFFEDDPGLRHTLEFYLGADGFDVIRDELSAFGAVAAGPLQAALPCDPAEAARLIHQSGLMALHSEPGNAVEHVALCHMIARTGDLAHLRGVALESGLAKLISVVDVEELRFEFMAGLLDRRVEARPRLGKTAFPLDFPAAPFGPVPAFRAGETPGLPGTLTGPACRVNRPDANLILALASMPEDEFGLCLAQAGVRRDGDSATVGFDAARAWRIGSRRHSLEFMLDFLRANDQTYTLVHVAGLLRVHGKTPAAAAWSRALLAGCIYLSYLDDMVELGHARSPEAVFRRVMLECSDAFMLDVLPRRLSRAGETEAVRASLDSLRVSRDAAPRSDEARASRPAREMSEKNLWPFCLDRLGKLAGELDDPRMERQRLALEGAVESLGRTVESSGASADSAPAEAGRLFLIVTLACEINWALKQKNEDDRSVLDPLLGDEPA